MTSAAAERSLRHLSDDERRIVTLLGIPTLALALAVTVVTTYVPVVAEGFGGSSVIIGLIVGIEGAIALWLPLVVGAWSDRLRTRLGGRLPFLIAASPLLLLGLAAMAVAQAVGSLAAAAVVFFLGYFVAYEPYRALYPDALPDAVAGRAQGMQALWRGLGTGLALVGGGLLLGVGQAVPFAAAALAYVLAIAGFGWALARRGIAQGAVQSGSGGIAGRASQVLALVRDHAPLRAFLVANALWELSLAAMKTFVVLYVTKGLGFSRAEAALIIGAVATVVLVGAVAGGKLADRYGRVAVMRIALPVYGGGLLVPLLVTAPLAVAMAAPVIALGGGVLMALPYALLIPLMPEGEHGALTGFYSLTRGLGTWLGPLLAGFAISALTGPFSATDGYQATWGVCSAAVLVSLLPLRRLARSGAV
jgi:MFS family permease